MTYDIHNLKKVHYDPHLQALASYQSLLTSAPGVPTVRFGSGRICRTAISLVFQFEHVSMTLPETNSSHSSHLKSWFLVIFQPSIFRGELLGFKEGMFHVFLHL